MAASYIAKAKVKIPGIAADRDIACIIADVVTWHGPTRPGEQGRYVTERVAIPVHQAGIAMHKGHATTFDPETGERRGCISPSVKNFQDAIGKRISWGKRP